MLGRGPGHIHPYVPPAASFIENSPRQYLSFADGVATQLPGVVRTPGIPSLAA